MATDNDDYWMNWWELPAGTSVVQLTDENTGTTTWQRPVANSVVFPLAFPEDINHTIRLDALDSTGTIIATVTN